MDAKYILFFKVLRLAAISPRLIVLVRATVDTHDDLYRAFRHGIATVN
jgi:hypothetical protein